MYITTYSSSNVQLDVITYVAKVLNTSAKNDLNNNELILAAGDNGRAQNLTVVFKMPSQPGQQPTMSHGQQSIMLHAGTCRV